MHSSKIDIQITEVKRVTYHVEEKNLLDDSSKPEYNYKVPVSTKLVLDFKGKDVNNIIINTLRRVSMDDIPCYAYTFEQMKITDNTSIFNNDMVRCRLEQLPVPNIICDLFDLDESFWKNIDYSDPKRLKHPKEKSLELNINVYNNTNDIKNVTTNDSKFYEDGYEIVDKYNKECPILLIQLRPAETFKCTMRAVLGVGLRSNIWAASGNSYFDDNTIDVNGNIIDNENNRTTLTIESLGQYTEYDILIKSCMFIKKKLDAILNNVMEKINSKELIESKEMIFILDNEDHTMGELLNDSFQNHPDIIFSGVSKSDHFIRSMKIIICVNKLKSPIKPMIEQIELLKQFFDHIEKLLTNMSKKSLKS
jgi:DNA-directed RNA polymerase subunit L